ncbi:MAG: serine hydrolase domain-containing protein [Bacteroidota bacterium]
MDRLLVFSLLIPILLQSQFLPAQSLSPKMVEAIDEVFAQHDNYQSPGAALAVVQKGKIVYSRGYGMADLEHALRIQPNTVFYIGSVSKMFVTACILLLEEEGKVDLDADVREYLPELPDYGYKLTLRNFIHHTSGIRDYLQMWDMKGRSAMDEIQEQDVLDLICAQKELNFEPGTRYLYSNSCYFIMAQIVNRVSGKSIREYGQEKIFGPLGMTHTQFYDDNRILIKNRAFGYGPWGGNGFQNMMMRFDLVGSGGIYSTVEDLYKWDQNFYHNILGKGGQELIEKMLTSGTFNDGSEIGYAYGIDVGSYRGLKAIGHGGALAGYRAEFRQYPEQESSVIILSNVSNFNPGQKASKVADILLKEAFPPEPEATPENMPAITEMSEKQLQKYLGHYWNDWDGNTREIILEDGSLFYKRGRVSRTKLMPHAENRFFMEGISPAVWVEFEAGGLKVIQEGQPNAILTRYEPVEPDLKEIQALAGTYHAPELGTDYELVEKDGKLHLLFGPRPIPFDPVMKDVFKQDFVGVIKVERDKKGRLQQVRLDAGRVRKLAMVKTD